MRELFLKIEFFVNGFLNFSCEPREIQMKNTINCKRLLYIILFVFRRLIMAKFIQRMADHGTYEGDKVPNSLESFSRGPVFFVTPVIN